MIAYSATSADSSPHYDVIKWKHFPRYWSFERGIHRSPVNFPHKCQWRVTLVFSLICALNKRLSKQSRGWWFETPSRSLWRHCNELNLSGKCWPAYSGNWLYQTLIVRWYRRYSLRIYIFSWHQAITKTNSDFLSTGLLGTNFGENLIKAPTFYFGAFETITSGICSGVNDRSGQRRKHNRFQISHECLSIQSKFVKS